MVVSNRNLLFQGLIFRFHVNLQGCTICVTLHLQCWCCGHVGANSAASRPSTVEARKTSKGSAVLELSTRPGCKFASIYIYVLLAVEVFFNHFLGLLRSLLGRERWIRSLTRRSLEPIRLWKWLRCKWPAAYWPMSKIYFFFLRDKLALSPFSDGVGFTSFCGEVMVYSGNFEPSPIGKYHNQQISHCWKQELKATFAFSSKLKKQTFVAPKLWKYIVF